MLRERLTSGRARAGIAAAYGLLAAAWVYAEQRQIDLSQTAYDFTSETPAILVFFFLAVVTGFAVGRFWALLALLGPIMTLGAMQATGYVSPWHDGSEPLTSLPSIARLVWLALMILVGIGLSFFARNLGSSSLDGNRDQAESQQH